MPSCCAEVTGLRHRWASVAGWGLFWTVYGWLCGAIGHMKGGLLAGLAMTESYRLLRSIEGSR